MKASELKERISSGKYDDRLLDIYADRELIGRQQDRYAEASDKFIELYGDREIEVYS